MLNIVSVVRRFIDFLFVIPENFGAVAEKFVWNPLYHYAFIETISVIVKWQSKSQQWIPDIFSSAIAQEKILG